MGGLNVRESGAHILAGLDRPNRNIEGPIIVLLGNGRLTAGRFFLFVDLASLLLLQDFATHGLAVNPVGEFGNRRLSRDRERIDGFEVGAMRVMEDLLNCGYRIAVFDHPGYGVVPDFECRLAAVGGGKQPRGIRRA